MWGRGWGVIVVAVVIRVVVVVVVVVFIVIVGGRYRMAVNFRGAQITVLYWLGTGSARDHAVVGRSRDGRDRVFLLPVQYRVNLSDYSVNLVRTHSLDIILLATHYIHQLRSSLIVAFLALPDWPLR